MTEALFRPKYGTSRNGLSVGVHLNLLIASVYRRIKLGQRFSLPFLMSPSRDKSPHHPMIPKHLRKILTILPADRR
jgi:hypothetical protein